MKTTKQKIKEILRAHKKQALSCLYPENDRAWGSTRKNRENSVNLMRSILKDISLDTWPEENRGDQFFYNYLIVRDGNWRLDLFKSEGEYNANLIYAKDDHTAWVRLNRNKKWVDFDIGGS